MRSIQYGGVLMTKKANLLPIPAKALPIFRVLWERGPLSRGELQDLTGLKLTTLVRSLEELERGGFIIECGQGESTGGRRPVLYDINRSRAALIGVDISRTYVKVGWMDMRSQLKESHTISLDESHTPEKVVSAIGSFIKNFSFDAPVLGIGIGAVGPLNIEKGQILNPIHFPGPGWDDVPIVEMLEEETGYPAFLENGANCAALAEFYFGEANGCRSAGYIHIGVGIRSGVLNHGRLVRTMDNRDDILGHMIVDMNGKACYCGRYGCLEAYCSLNAMLKEYINGLKRGRSSDVLMRYKGAIDSIDYHQFFKEEKRGDPLAIQIILDGAAVMAIGIANFASLMDLDMVIINGPLIQLSNIFFDECVKIAGEKALKPIIYSKGQLGSNAIVMGAGLNALNKSLGLFEL